MQQHLIIALAIVGYAAAAAVDTVVEIQTPANENANNRTLLTVNEECHQPKETGRCFALFHRYAFNVESFGCEEFIYGGCAGNKNNFETKEECERFCLQAANAESTTEAAVTVSESEAASTESTDAGVEEASSTASATTTTEGAKVDAIL